jgi:hypothetical protein
MLIGKFGQVFDLKYFMWRDTSISRARRLGVTKNTTPCNFSLGGVSFKILD